MIKVSLLTPESSRDFEASAVFLPGTQGRFEVLPGHADIISTLDKGEIILRLSGGGEKHFPTEGGVMRLQKDTMTICAALS